jgi:site-specific recombinase XerC
MRAENAKRIPRARFAFLNWLLRNERIAHNPLAKVIKAETKGRERRVRRALNDEEINRLIQASGKRALPYFVRDCPTEELAERVGFEPTVPFRARLISSQVR